MAGELPALVKARCPEQIPIEVTPGELLDRLTIMEIKCARLTEATQRAMVREEAATLRRACEAWIVASEELTGLRAQLRAVNEALWDSEDRVRLCERAGDFGPTFIELARSVYRQNDRRSALKRQINDLLGVPQGEVKVYADYRRAPEEARG